jgi:hypothetical protein
LSNDEGDLPMLGRLPRELTARARNHAADHADYQENDPDKNADVAHRGELLVRRTREWRRLLLRVGRRFSRSAD